MYAVRACAVLLAANALSQPARADLGVLSVAPSPGPGPELVEITLQLRERMAERDRRVLPGGELRERMLGPSLETALAELEAAHEAARVAYVGGDYDGSARTLRAIVERLEALPDGSEAFAQWKRAMLRLARIELNLGHDDAAAAVLDRLVRAAPQVAVDRNLYTARFADALQRARAAVLAAPSLTVAVRASIEGARVYLNGRDVGTAPLDLVVPPGRHRVSGTKDALRTGPVFVELGSDDREVFLDFTLSQSLRPDAGPGLAVRQEDEVPRVLSAGAHLRLDEIVAVSLREEAGVAVADASLYDVTRGARKRHARVRLREGKLPVGGSSALAEFLVTGAVRSTLVELPGAPQPLSAVPAAMDAPPGAVPHVTRVDISVPDRPRLLGWVTLGTGVVAVGFAVVGVLQTRAATEHYDRARSLQPGDLVTVEGVRVHNRYVAEGDDARRRAAAAWAGAAATAAAAGVLGYVNYRRTGEFGPFRF